MSINKPGVVELLTLFFSASPSYFCWADRRWILMPVWNFEIECFCLFVFVVFGFSLSITSITFRRNILCSYIYLMVCLSHAHLTQNMCVCENNVVRWNKWKKLKHLEFLELLKVYAHLTGQNRVFCTTIVLETHLLRNWKILIEQLKGQLRENMRKNIL